MKKFAIICMVMLSAIANAQKDHAFDVTKNLDIFNTIYRELDMLYVDSLEAQQTLLIAIDAMLDGLDPYTEYYQEEDMGDLKMMTTGKYGGIGSMIRMRKDSTVIIGNPYEGMPAAQVGLKVGDVLLSIDGKSLKGMAVAQVSDMLRGEPGTSFVLRVQRPGEKKPREFRIVRQSIKMPAVPYYGLHGTTGYISLTQFTENCSKEVRKAVISLKEKGAKSIVLDLRENGGGLLSEAVEIVNLFVPKGVTVVEMRGRQPNTNYTHTTTKEPLDLNIPLCVLVNGSTASAAEIVSGSLQDLDRAVIIGTKTFGKGLVQSTRDLSYNSSLKLTTAKYYIHSGRCIQAIDYKRRREDMIAAAKGQKSAAPKDSTQTKGNLFHTDSGRPVYDSHGITPDIVIKHDTMPNLLYYLTNDDVLVDYGTKYCQSHPTIAPAREFVLTDQDYADFKEMVIASGFKYDRLSEKRLEDLKKMAKFEGYYDDAKAEFDALEAKLSHNLSRDLDIHQKLIRRMVAIDIVQRYYYQAGSAEYGLIDDEDFAKALELLASPDEMAKILSPQNSDK